MGIDRRTFLATAGAAIIAPALPPRSAPICGVDFAYSPSQTVTQLLAVRDGAIREIHRVTGIPRYQLGADGLEHDTWQDQVEAGLSEIIRMERVT